MTAPYDPDNDGDGMPQGAPPPPMPPIPNSPTQFPAKAMQHKHVPPHKKGHAHKGGPAKGGGK